MAITFPASFAGSTTRESPRENALLAALPEPDYQRIAALLIPVQLQAGQLLHDGALASYAWFPAGCILSLQVSTESGACAEVACIGSEGVAGVEAVLADGARPQPALVRSAGLAWRLPVPALQREFAHSSALQAVLLAYVQVLFLQLMQSAACSRHHSVDQQLCRCLLASLDRQPGQTLHMTQEFIAGLLGVRRESVTEAARRLQQAGIIHYSRGHIEVLDRAALEVQACECYAVTRQRQAGPRRIAA